MEQKAIKAVVIEGVVDLMDDVKIVVAVLVEAIFNED